MEILYLYIDKYKALENQEFNLSREYGFLYNKDKNELKIERRDDFLGTNFFGKKINQVNAIVGKNGKGKSTALELIEGLLSDIPEYVTYSYILAYKLHATLQKENDPEIVIEFEGFEMPYLLNQDKVKALVIHAYRSKFKKDTKYDRKVIFFSNFYDGTINQPSSCIDISTNKMVADTTNNDYGIGSYSYQELQRTITYFASSPKYIDQNDFNIPNFISLDVNIDYAKYSEFQKQQTDEVDSIIVEIKGKLREEPKHLLLCFYLAFFIQVSLSPDKESFQVSLSQEIPKQLSTELLFSDDAKKIVSFLNEYRLKLFPSIPELITKSLKVIINELIGKKEYNFQNIIIESPQSKKLDSFKKLLENISFFNFSKYVPFSYRWSFEKDGPEVRLSSGEKAFYALFSRLDSNIVPKHKKTSYIILLDEPGLTLHPQWEKAFLKNLIDQIEKTFDNLSDNSIQLFITSHSPIHSF